MIQIRLFVYGLDNQGDLLLLLRTVDSGVGLDKHLTVLLPQQDRLPQTQEVVRAAVADSGVALVQSSASVHVRRRLEHLTDGDVRP